ncbi:hypothetical protein [Actinomadura rugatobispora]|uniref:Uncharacterized protein n=1 Tax=Actinomadura rugatobispora TaxID=1994 RepID=A0ABW1A058_9ACTN|nr:hypothetical protein GCM10010200_042540 [Actinomadura rugatobispora]
MRPPHCFVCGLSLRDIDDDQDLWSVFTLVTFELTHEEKTAHQARDRSGWVGHPENTEWFCNQHAALAQERSHLHWRTALSEISATHRPDT